MTLAAGLFDLGFAIFHLAFWRLFDWPRSLAAAGGINAGVTQVLNLCLTFVLSAGAAWLLADDPGRGALLVTAGFWTFRAALQPLHFGLRHPASIALFLLFALGSLMHAVPALV